MSTTAQLAEVRRQATEYARLQQAAALLPEMERQAEMEAAEAKAQARAEELTAALDAELAKLEDADTATTHELTGLLRRMEEWIDRRRDVARQADRCYEISRQLATVRFRRTHQHEPVDSVHYMRGEIQARSEQILINKGYTNARLLVLAEPSDEVGAYLVNFLARLTGDTIAPRRDPVAGAPVVIIDHEGNSRWG